MHYCIAIEKPYCRFLRFAAQVHARKIWYFYRALLPYTERPSIEVAKRRSCPKELCNLEVPIGTLSRRTLHSPRTVLPNTSQIGCRNSTPETPTESACCNHNTTVQFGLTPNLLKDSKKQLGCGRGVSATNEIHRIQLFANETD